LPDGLHRRRRPKVHRQILERIAAVDRRIAELQNE
jgi:hypothetical protein